MADDVLDELSGLTSIYCRPDELVINVAYKVKRFERVDNKSRPGQKSNRAILHYSPDIELMFYLPSKYVNIEEQKFKEWNENITKGRMQYFIVNKVNVHGSKKTTNSDDRNYQPRKRFKSE